MKFRALGTSGIDASVVGVGTWAIGGWMWGGTDEGAAIRALHAAIDAGINLVDTAPVYGFGTSEDIVGKAIKGRRDKVVLATKCGLVWHMEEGDHFFNSDGKGIDAEGQRKVHRYLGPKAIRYEIEQSLLRLGVETIDLYQTHWQDSTTAIADTMAELVKLRDEGKIRAIGVSNATVDDMDEYRKVGRLDSDQERYSMLDPTHEADLLPYCAENQVAFLAYSPLANGLLTGKIGPDRTFGEGDLRIKNPRFSVENRAVVKELLNEFLPIADGRGLTLAQLVIAWTAHQPGCSHVLVGARNPEQALENAAAGEVTLSADELAQMARTVEAYASRIK